MTHNIQIGINVDDDSIINGVKAEAIHNIQKALFGKIIAIDQWCYRKEYRFSDEFKRDYLDKVFDKLFSDPELREGIIKETASVLADRLMKSTAFKQKIADNVNNRQEQSK